MAADFIRKKLGNSRTGIAVMDVITALNSFFPSFFHGLVLVTLSAGKSMISQLVD